MNQSDAERLRSILDGMGGEQAETEDEAELLGIVACSVRQKAIDKAYGKIELWNRWKSRRPLLTFITGCILPADRLNFLKLFDLVLPVGELPRLPSMIRTYGVPVPAGLADQPERAPQDAAVASLEFWRVAPRRSSRFEAFLPIQNGCDKMCTFCAVPYTRGREVSRPSQEILAEIRDLMARGYATITLLGQNVNSYGLDRNGAEMGFPELLSEIGRLGREAEREVWVYFTSPHPRDMSADVLEAVAEWDCLAKQIHLPLQSGDDRLLIRMNRNYRLDQYRAVVREIREILPGATLFTDVIVGFCGETPEQFEATRAALEEFRYNMAYIAAYSPRPGAASSRWPDDVPQEEKKRRLHILSEVLRRHSHDYNLALAGETVRVLVDGHDRLPGHLSGRTEGRLPVRFPGADEGLIGTFVDVTITGAAELSLAGELAQPVAAT
jgi:tRNA-2-methylthio-N6-dimethylallyladenosine synthase